MASFSEKPGSGLEAPRLVLRAAAPRPPVHAGLLRARLALAESADAPSLPSPKPRPDEEQFSLSTAGSRKRSRAFLLAAASRSAGPLVPRADGLRWLRRRSRRTAPPAAVGRPPWPRQPAAAAAPPHERPGGPAAAVPATFPAATAPAPGGATTCATSVPSQPRRQRRGQEAALSGAGEFGSQRGGQGSCGGGKEVAGGAEAGGREFARSEACLVFSGWSCPGPGISRPAHTQCPRGALCCSCASCAGNVYPRLCQSRFARPGALKEPASFTGPSPATSYLYEAISQANNNTVRSYGIALWGRLKSLTGSFRTQWFNPPLNNKTFILEAARRTEHLSRVSLK